MLSFWQLYHDMTPFDAAKDLAKTFGVDIARFAVTEKDTERVKLRKYVQKFVSALHSRLLATGPVLEYVTKRGVSIDTLKAFQVGYSQKPVKHQAHASELERDDMFTDALVFPVVDYMTGDIMLYSRPMTTGKGQKYISLSSRWPMKYGGAMFGFDQARKAKRRALVAVEGFFDALALHSAGMDNVICTLGATMRQEQLDYMQMAKVRELTVLFDSDKAGEHGAQKALELVRRDLRLKLAFLPELDPDEYLIKYGMDALATVLHEAASPADVLINQYLEAFESGDYYDKEEAIKKVMQCSLNLPQVERTVIVDRIRKLSQLTEGQVWDMASGNGHSPRGLENSERMVLAHAIQDKAQFISCASRVPNDQDFWRFKTNARIWEVVTAGYNKNIQHLEPEILCDLDQSLSGNELKALKDKETSEVEYHLDQLNEAYTRRKLRAIAKRLDAMVDTKTPSVDIIGEHLATVASQASQTMNVEFSAQAQVNLAMRYVDERMRSQATYPGINLGKNWAELMDSILGFQPSYMYLLAATPKAGKTTCAQNWALWCATQLQIPTLWLGLEMSERDLALRNLSIISGLSNMKVRRGQLTDHEKKVLDKAAGVYHSSPFHMVNAAGMTVHEIVNVMRKYVYTHGVKIIFLDYIQLINIKGPRGQELWEGHMQVSTELKNAIQKDVKVPLIAVSQLNRYAGHEKSSTGINIAGSFKYIQDCDCYMGIRPLTLKERDSGLPGDTLLSLEFNRHGPQDVQIRLHFNKENLRITEVT